MSALRPTADEVGTAFREALTVVGLAGWMECRLDTHPNPTAALVETVRRTEQHATDATATAWDLFYRYMAR